MLECSLFVLMVVASVLGVVWVVALLQLMRTREQDFPVRYDRYLWFVAFLLAPALAPIAFLLWKQEGFAHHPDQPPAEPPREPTE